MSNHKFRHQMSPNFALNFPTSQVHTAPMKTPKILQQMLTARHPEATHSRSFDSFGPFRPLCPSALIPYLTYLTSPTLTLSVTVGNRW
jgi:hypothetical protein